MLAACQIPLLSFFFQAEDGIRDWSVTGVQTCALPICECRVLAAGDPLPALPPRPWLPGRGSRHRRPLGGAVPAACRRAARARVVPAGRLPAELGALQADGAEALPRLVAAARRALRRALAR